MKGFFGALKAALVSLVLVASTLVSISPANAYDSNRCLNLSGSNLLEAQRPLIPVSEAFTVEMWVYSNPENRGKFAHFISQGSRPWPFYLGLTPAGNLRAGDAWSDTGIPFPFSEWVHLAFTYDGNGKATIFLDGETKLSVGNFKTTDGPTNTRLGAQWEPKAREFFSGCLDDVRIFRGTRTDDQIKTSMSLSTEQFFASTVSSRLLTAYSFDLSTNYESAKIVGSQIRDVGKGIAGDASENLVANEGNVQLPPRMDYVSLDPLRECLTELTRASSLVSAPNTPLITRIVSRSNTDMTVDLDLSNTPDRSCVGVDLYIQGSGTPISSTVGIRQIRDSSRNRLSVDMTPVKCYYNKTQQLNHPFMLRAWYSLDGRSSRYSSEIEVPPCSGVQNSNPSDPSRILANNETISLLSSTTTSVKMSRQSNLRAEAQGLLNANISNSGNTWRVIEDWGCHANTFGGSVEVFENNSWREVTAAQGNDRSTGCPATHPFQPYANIALKDGQLFRWKINVGWIAYSPVRAYFSSESIPTGGQSDITNPNPNLAKAVSPVPQGVVTVPVVSNRPTTPTFSSVNFSGNTINIDVNIGSSSSSRPDKIYLVAPKLGISQSKPLAGTISGSSAKWSIDFDKVLAGTSIPLEIVGEKDGVKSDALTGSYQVPQIAPVVSRSPLPPTNLKQRTAGSSLIVTTAIKQSRGAIATDAFLVSKSLGKTKSEPLQGDVIGSQAVFEIPFKSSMSGKKFSISIYYQNSAGESKPLNGTLVIPRAPKPPTIKNQIPTPVVPTTVICVRSSQTRTFSGTKCPPGWVQG